MKEIYPSRKIWENKSPPEYNRGYLDGVTNVPVEIDIGGKLISVEAKFVKHKDQYDPDETDLDYLFLFSGFGCSIDPSKNETYFSLLAKAIKSTGKKLKVYEFYQPGVLQPHGNVDLPNEVYSLKYHHQIFEKAFAKFIKHNCISPESNFYFHGHSQGSVPVACADASKLGVDESKIHCSLSGPIMGGLGINSRAVLRLEPFRQFTDNSVRKLNPAGANYLLARSAAVSFPVWQRVLGLPNDEYFSSIENILPKALAVHIKGLAELNEILKGLPQIHSIEHLFYGKKDELIDKYNLRFWAEHNANLQSGQIHEFEGDHVLERNPVFAKKMAGIIFREN